MLFGPRLHGGARCPQTFVALAAAVLLPGLSGCDGCGGEPPGEAQPTLVLQAAAGTTLEADGVKVAAIEIRAFDVGGKPDDSPITVAADVGTLSAGSESGQSLTLAPSDGRASFTYMCERLHEGAVRIQATNGKAQGALTIRCVQPNGTFVLEVDSSDCDDLAATGEDACRVDLAVYLRTATQNFATLGGGFTLNVDVTAVQNQNPNDQRTDDAVLSIDGNGPLRSTLTVITSTADDPGVEEPGTASFYVHSPALALAQDVTLEIHGTGPAGEAVASGPIVISIQEFRNQSAITILASRPLNMATNQVAEFRLEVVDDRGRDALQSRRGMVTVSVPEESGALLSTPLLDEEPASEVRIRLSEVGGGDAGPTEVVMAVHAPEVVGGTLEFEIIAQYRPQEVLNPVTDNLRVRVHPENQLIMNVVASPTTFESDSDEPLRNRSQIQVTLSRLVEGAEVPVEGATVLFAVRQSDLDRVGFGVPQSATPLSATEEKTSDEHGTASVTLAAKNTRVRGQVAVDVSASFTDTTGEEQTSEARVFINITRKPILQSIIFVSADPLQIGVRGSPYPSAASLRFQILDDVGAPIADVPVTFDVNAPPEVGATVDPGPAFSDAQGMVVTSLAAGTQAGPVTVTATATYRGTVLATESLPVTITGGLPAFGNSALACDLEGLLQEVPFSVGCTVSLVDRFTNRVPAGVGVHFRAEGGNIDPYVPTGADGTARAVFQTGAPGASTASLYSRRGDSWSYGAILPAPNDFVNGTVVTDDGTHFGPSAAAACVDGNAMSQCDVVGLCRIPENGPYCPLPPDKTYPDDGCWEHLNAFALTQDPADIGRELLERVTATRGGNPNNQADLDNTLLYLVSDFDPSFLTGYYYVVDDDPDDDASIHEIVRDIVDVYLENISRCGVLASCLIGPHAGLSITGYDDCPVDRGCNDFDPATHCPQDGLFTIMAAARGEESFIDLNGSGAFDFTDLNGDAVYNAGEPGLEPFIDLPEPYLDKNDNCYYDSLDGSVRLSGMDKLRHTDLFNDEDESGDFGFKDPLETAGPRLLTNGYWDRDKQIFFQTHVVGLTGVPKLEYGQPCTAAEAGTQVQCDLAEVFAHEGLQTTAECQSVGAGAYLAPGCIEPLLGANRVPILFLNEERREFRIAYRWIDDNGNCYSPGFAYQSEALGTSELLSVFSDEVPLDPVRCGVFGGRDQNRPWCKVVPNLGSPLIEISVSTMFTLCNLEDTNAGERLQGPQDTPVLFFLGAGGAENAAASATLPIVTYCPLCGDEVIEGWEECDDGNQSGGDGCSPECRLE